MHIASAVAMVRPAAFGFNEETAANNFFQDSSQKNNADLQKNAVGEFDAMVSLLRKNDIEVLVLEDDPVPPKPDAIFPNNWFSCNDNRITIFPMCAVNRRAEKRASLIDILKHKTGISEIFDLGRFEEQNIFLEGTGSMVIDHCSRVIFACISARTNRELLKQFAADHQYQSEIFAAADEKGREIYHTNVLMCIGDSFAVICIDAVHPDQRTVVLKRLTETGHEIIDISFEQMNSFAGNMLQLVTGKNEKILVMSKTAFRSLSAAQVNALEKHSRLVVPDISSIERTAGGSARCMMAELFF